MNSRIMSLTACLLGTIVFSGALADPPSFLRIQEDVPLTGGVSRFDYQTYDPQAQLLYLSHMGAGQIIVFNTQQEKVIATLSGFPGVTSLLVLPQYHRLYAGVTQNHMVAVLDTQSRKVIARVPAGNFPDGMAYVPETHQLYVSDEKGGEVTVIDVLKNKRTTSIKLGGQAGNTRYDSSSRLVYTCGQTKNELVSINPDTLKIANRYPIKGGKHPHGLWIDPNSHLAFIGCDGNAKLSVMDLTNFQETGVADVGKDPDVLTFDTSLGYLYVASESGVVSIFRVRDRKIEKIGDFPVGENAHSVEVDSQTHFVYFPLRKVNRGPVLRIMKPAN
jgi:DNA-binding beta-propeller fold protein YncE